MSLHERYNAFTKRNIKQWLVLVIVCVLSAFFLIFGSSLARYTADWNGHLGTGIAQWKIQINGVTLSDDSVASALHVTLIPDTDVIPEYPEKIKAGQTGHFDVKIDPAGTQVSFSYRVAVDLVNSKLPHGMHIDAYSVTVGENIGSTIAFSKDDKSVGGVIALPVGGIFTTDNSVTVRFYWTWEDVDFDEFAVYDIVVTATVQQYLGEGAHTL